MFPKKTNFKYYPKNELYLAILLFFLPLFNFINPANIKQIDTILLLFLFFFNLFICFIFLTTSYLIKNYIIKKKISNYFIIISLFYFILFFYNETKFFMDTINSLSFNSKRISWIISKYYNEITVFLIFFITFIFCYLNYKKKKFRIFFKTFIVIFLSINLLLNFYYFYSYREINNTEKLDASDLNLPKINYLNNINEEKKNIYYIIFDRMISLENAYKQNIITNEETIVELKKKLENIKIKYITDSISNYNLTYLSLSTIFYLNSPVNEKSPQYKNNALFYPQMLEKKNLITLPKLLSNNNYNFYYFGNNWHQCINNKINNINCFMESSNSKYTNILESFYINTPFVGLAKIFLKHNHENNTANFFLKNFKIVSDKMNQSLINQKGNFIFVHVLMPHSPFLDKNCDYNPSPELTSYAHSYSCAIDNILNIGNFFYKEDPSALLIFQADHGWVTKFNNNADPKRSIYSQDPILNGKINKSITNEIYFRSSIFNSIKAPEKCFEMNPSPTNNSNTIKFIFNCVFNYNLSYEKPNHYIGFYASNRNYGNIFKIEK